MNNVSYLKTLLVQGVLITAPLLGHSAYSIKEQPEELYTSVSNLLFTETEAHFMFAAAAINLEEIQLGQLAEQKGMATEVKELGKMMEVAHHKFSDELVLLAKKKMITIPTLPTDEAQNAYIKLSSKSATDFDTEYCNMVVTQHKQAIRMFEKAAKEFTDNDIKEWIIVTLPELRKHLAYARKCQEKSGKIEITQE